MTSFEKFFDGRLFVINRSARVDRWQHALAQFDKFGLKHAQRFEACVYPVPGRHDQNTGCTLSHRTLLDMQIANEWPRMMVLEDDFEIVYGDFHDRWNRAIPHLPPDWDILYLGGGYGETPQYRVNDHFIRTGRMMTTSSYGITLGFAKQLAPYIEGSGPIDCLSSDRLRDAKSYVISPRLFIQYANHSDLQGKFMNNAASMLDTRLEAKM